MMMIDARSTNFRVFTRGESMRKISICAVRSHVYIKHIRYFANTHSETFEGDIERLKPFLPQELGFNIFG